CPKKQRKPVHLFPNTEHDSAHFSLKTQFLCLHDNETANCLFPYNPAFSGVFQEENFHGFGARCTLSASVSKAQIRAWKEQENDQKQHPQKLLHKDGLRD